MQLGEVLATELKPLARRRAIPPLDRFGIVLGGDLYVDPLLKKRGGLGDVRDVWRALGRRTRWVAGVAGNHDELGGSAAALAEFNDEPGVHVVDATVTQVDGLTIGGVGGVVGPPSKPNRRTLPDFIAAVDEVLAARPDLLVLHQGPPPVSGGTRGIPELRERLSSVDTRDLLVVFGHDRWKQPLEILPNGVQLLNVHGRVVILRRAE